MKSLLLGLLFSPVLAFAGNSGVVCQTSGFINELTVTITSDGSLLDEVSTVTVNSAGGMRNYRFVTRAARVESADPGQLILKLVQIDGVVPVEATLTLNLLEVIAQPRVVVPTDLGHLVIDANAGIRGLGPYYDLYNCKGSL